MLDYKVATRYIPCPVYGDYVKAHEGHVIDFKGLRTVSKNTSGPQ